MRKNPWGLVALAAVISATALHAQKPLSFELGGFGQFTLFDKNLKMDNAATLGGRASLFLLQNFSAEVDGEIGKTNWKPEGGTTTSITLHPWSVRMIYGIPLSDRAQLVFGAGYHQSQFIGRKQEVAPGTEAPNEYEDGFTGLTGIKWCLNQKWNFRADLVGIHEPSPDFTGDLATLNGKSTTYGLRAGIGWSARGICPKGAAPPPPPPPAPAPPPPAPAPAPAPTPPPPPPPPANTPPRITITAPSSGASFNGPVTMTATCTDAEDGDLSSQVAWTSSRDGAAGTGASVSRRLTNGAHTLTATCRDSQGLSATASASVRVEELLVRLSWVYFNFDKSTLTAIGRDTLNKIISTLKTQTSWKVAVEGHTDPYGKDEYNQGLSERRAASVVDYLQKGGIDMSRISQKGYGEQCLLLDDDHDKPQKSKTEHRVNRRVEVWSVGDAGPSPACRAKQ